MMKVTGASQDMIKINIVSYNQTANIYISWDSGEFPLSLRIFFYTTSPDFHIPIHWLSNVVWIYLSASKTKLRRKKILEEDLKIVEGDSKEMLTEKFLSLRDAYDKLKDENTLLEYENESLKDYQDEREEEVNTKHINKPKS